MTRKIVQIMKKMMKHMILLEDIRKIWRYLGLSVKGDFKEPWKFIEASRHSIERYTNLLICLEEEMEK